MPKPAFDYGLESALVFRSESICTKRPLFPVPFQRASDAIRFVIEKLRSDSFEFVYLGANGKHYNDAQIRDLYDAASYPLKRSQPVTRFPWPCIVDDYPSPSRFKGT